MLSLLISIAALWLVLRIALAVIELPFYFIGALFSAPLSTIFWIVMIVLIVYSLNQRRSY